MNSHSCQYWELINQLEKVCNQTLQTSLEHCQMIETEIQQNRQLQARIKEMLSQ